MKITPDVKNIIINGRACSGKDEVADYLVENYGYTKLSFAHGIYEIAKKYFGMEKKDRTLLQAIGEKMREIDPNVWLNATFNTSRYYNRAVISDCRRANEYNRGREEGFIPFRVSAALDIRIQRAIKRDGTEPDLDEWENESETGADEFSYFEIDNNGTLTELHRQIDKLMSGLNISKNA